jgi:hypothetical protein
MQPAQFVPSSLCVHQRSPAGYHAMLLVVMAGRLEIDEEAYDDAQN